MTKAELLVLIDDAIEKILGGAQEYQIHGRRWRGADLSELRQWKREVEKEIARAARGSALGYGVPIP